jgi:hypothetical protein
MGSLAGAESLVGIPDLFVLGEEENSYRIVFH